MVIVIEDDALIANLLRETIEEMGSRVFISSSGPDGLEAARAERPDLVLADLGLPGQPGSEVIRELKADPLTAAIPIIAVTAASNSEERARDAGSDDFLAKPFDLEDLEAKVRGFLNLA